MEIPIFYDPMIAKLITYAATRQEAIQRMIRAIDEYQITGVQTTLSFCKFVLQHQAFVSGKFDTHFVNQHFKPELLQAIPSEEEASLAPIFGAYLTSTTKKSNSTSNNRSTSKSKWKDRLK